MSNRTKYILSFFILSAFISLTLLAKFNLTEQFDFNLTVKLQNFLESKQRLTSYLPKILFLADPILISILIVLTAAIFWRQSILIILCFLILVGVEIYGKHELQHPPPPHFMAKRFQDAPVPKYYVREVSSYPSGHAARSAYLTILWTVLFREFLTKRQTSIHPNETQIQPSSTRFFSKLLLLVFSLALFTLALFIGITKIYLGEHWTSDVFGGWLLGAALAIIATLKLKRPS